MAIPTTNALDVLIDALPTSQASSLEQQFSISIQTTSGNSISTTQSSQTSSIAISSSAASTSSQLSSQLSSQASLTTSQSSTSHSTTTTSSSSSASSQATAAPTAAPQASKTPGEIAGIATGSVAGFILILVAIFLLLRFRQKRNGSHNGSGTSSLLGSIIGRREKVYPEVAWLYDPVRPAERGARPGQEPYRAPAQVGRPSQEPLRADMAAARPSEDSVPRMGANAPWSSRPSTGNEQFDQQDGGLPYITQQSPLNQSMFQPPRSRSASHSNPQGYYGPAQPRHRDEEHGDGEVISPLLPPPVQHSRYVSDAPIYDGNGYGQIPMRSAMRSPANNRGQVIGNPGMHDGTGRAF